MASPASTGAAEGDQVREHLLHIAGLPGFDLHAEAGQRPRRGLLIATWKLLDFKKRPWYSTTVSKMRSIRCESIRWPWASTTSWNMNFQDSNVEKSSTFARLVFVPKWSFLLIVRRGGRGQAKVEYIGGTAPEITAGASGAITVNDAHYFAFYSRKANLRVAYGKVNLLEYGQTVGADSWTWRSLFAAFCW